MQRLGFSSFVPRTWRSRLVSSFVLLALGLAASGCVGVGSFELVVPIAEQRIDGNPLGGLLGGALFELPIPLDVDLAAETAARDTGPAQHVRLASLSLSITASSEPAGDSDDFEFVDSAEIFVESRDPATSLPRARIARVDTVEPGTRTLVFLVDDDVDLLPYVQEGARLSSRASGRVPPDDVSFDGRVVLAVEVL